MIPSLQFRSKVSAEIVLWQSVSMERMMEGKRLTPQGRMSYDAGRRCPLTKELFRERIFWKESVPCKHFVQAESRVLVERISKRKGIILSKYRRCSKAITLLISSRWWRGIARSTGRDTIRRGKNCETQNDSVTSNNNIIKRLFDNSYMWCTLIKSIHFVSLRYIC